MPVRPPTLDHQQKKPLERRVRVYLDDEPIEALAEARADLAEAEADAQRSYDRRLTLARSAAPTAGELLTLEEGLARDRDLTLEPARKAVVDAEMAVLAASQEYVFRSPHVDVEDGRTIRGRRAFEHLVAAHPPAPEDHDDVRVLTGRPEAVARWHNDTFMPALLAATCVDPPLTVEQATEMYEEWTDGELAELTGAALTVSQGTRQVDLGKASRAATTRG